MANELDAVNQLEQSENELIGSPSQLGVDGQPATTGVDSSMSTPEDEDVGFVDGVADVGMGVVRGGLAFGQSLYNLADALTFDALPDVDIRSVAGENKTVGGSLAEGITQFMLGFVPVAGQIGRVGAMASAGSKASKIGKFLTVADKSRKLSKAKLNWKGDMVAGSVSDFISFSGQEARLSNMIQEYPELSNPVTQYLSYEEGDGELEGRLKNSIEGMLAEVGLSVALRQGFLKSLDILREARKEVPADKDALDVVDVDKVQANASEVVVGADSEFTSNVIKESDEFKSNVWQPEQTEEGIKRPPFKPITEFPDELIDKHRGASKIIERLNKEAKNQESPITQSTVDSVNELFDVIGTEPFDDVAITMTKRMGSQGLFDFTKSVAEIGKDVWTSKNPEVIFHELGHAASRALTKGDRRKVFKAYEKERAQKKKETYYDKRRRFEKWFTLCCCEKFQNAAQL